MIHFHIYSAFVSIFEFFRRSYRRSIGWSVGRSSHVSIIVALSSIVLATNLFPIIFWFAKVVIVYLIFRFSLILKKRWFLFLSWTWTVLDFQILINARSIYCGNFTCLLSGMHLIHSKLAHCLTIKTFCEWHHYSLTLRTSELILENFEYSCNVLTPFFCDEIDGYFKEGLIIFLFESDLLVKYEFVTIWSWHFGS